MSACRIQDFDRCTSVYPHMAGVPGMFEVLKGNKFPNLLPTASNALAMNTIQGKIAHRVSFDIIVDTVLGERSIR